MRTTRHVTQMSSDRLFTREVTLAGDVSVSPFVFAVGVCQLLASLSELCEKWGLWEYFNIKLCCFVCLAL